MYVCLGVRACVQVLFQNDSVLFDSLPYHDAIPYREMSLHLPLMDDLSTAAPPASDAAGTLLPRLRRVSEGEIRHKQSLLRKYAPLLAYPLQKLAKSASGDAGGENAVSMAIARLAADVAPPTAI